MQISYHSALAKIQKLQNLKKKKKNFFLYLLVCPVPTGIARNWPVWLVRPAYKPVRNVEVSIPVCISVQYIPASTAGTGTVLTTLIKIQKLKINDLLFIENEDTSSKHKMMSYGNSLKKKEDTVSFCVNEELMILINMAPFCSFFINCFNEMLPYHLD